MCFFVRCFVLSLKHVRGNFILQTCHPKIFFPGTNLHVFFLVPTGLCQWPRRPFPCLVGRKRGRHQKQARMFLSVQPTISSGMKRATLWSGRKRIFEEEKQTFSLTSRASIPGISKSHVPVRGAVHMSFSLALIALDGALKVDFLYAFSFADVPLQDVPPLGPHDAVVTSLSEIKSLYLYKFDRNLRDSLFLYLYLH